MSQLPPEDKYVKPLKAPKGLKRCLNIPVLGHRDPRGPDNNIRVWVDKDDKLHVRVEKTQRCYSYEKTIEEDGYIEVIAS